MSARTRRTHLRLQRLEVRDVPTTFTVLNADDAGPGSLRQAILDANALAGPDVIDFDPAFFNAANPRTITLVSQELLITDDLTVNGPGPEVLSVSGGQDIRVFQVSNPSSVIDVTISGLTVRDGVASASPGGLIYGGGILLGRETLRLDRLVVTGNSAEHGGGGISFGVTVDDFGGTLIARNCTISSNTAGNSGGGIYKNGSLTLENCTIAGNTASLGGGIRCGSVSGLNIRNSTITGNTALIGGGFYLVDVGYQTLVIGNSTITGNTATTQLTAPGMGGGGIAQRIVHLGGSVVLRLESTIVSGNFAPAINGRSDIALQNGTVEATFSAIGDSDGFTLSGTSGNNLPFGLALGLGPLADNGGPTPTMALPTFSPAINAGANPAGLTTDQRGAGFARTVGVGTDIGAFEAQAVAAAPRIAGVTANGGQANTAQRSRVTTVTVTFDTQVTFAGTVAAAFGLSRVGGGAVGSFTATAAVVNGVTVVTLSGFTGAETESGSLADGRYSALVRANQVSAGGQQLDGNGDGSGGDDYVLNGTAANGLFRLYGDVNGDAVVNAADFAQFRNAFGLALGDPGYVDYLDINGNGVINAFDFAQFRLRFGATVP